MQCTCLSYVCLPPPPALTWVIIIYFIAEKTAKVKESVSHCSDVRLSSRLKTVIVLSAQRTLRTISSQRSLQLRDATGGPFSSVISLLCLLASLCQIIKNCSISNNSLTLESSHGTVGLSATLEILLILEGLTMDFRFIVMDISVGVKGIVL